MAERSTEEEPPAWVHAVFGVLFMICMGLIFYGCISLQIDVAKQTVKSVQKDITTRSGYAIGKVKSVENYKADKFVTKDGDMTLTLEITDRTKVTFEDGRSKELLGIPEEAIPTDREVAIIWAKYDIYLKWVDAVEFKKELELEKKEKADKEIVPESK